MTAIEAANAEQRRASDPNVSAFVAASAGSGKTKLLTDRLLRLMLTGTDPAKILCLTYTKAAAAEMTIRLTRTLGEWVVLDEIKLTAELVKLDVMPTAENLVAARRLFAEVLDLPGGMRIETIHAFCQSLLRRFPLEAGLSPHFELADDFGAGLRLREARESVMKEAKYKIAISALAAESDENSFAELLTKLVNRDDDLLLREAPSQINAMQRAALGMIDGDEASVINDVVDWPKAELLREMFAVLTTQGTNTGKEKAAFASAWLAKPHADRADSWHDWGAVFFTQAGEPASYTRWVGKALSKTRDDIEPAFQAESERISAINEKLRAIKLSNLNEHLVTLTGPILAAERHQKQNTAQLGYNDLITLTGKLMEDPGAAWILYKLDGGIDHLLLDEVQDTAPAQWAIAQAIADEFFAGEGAQEGTRSIFAVGDAKQSIFSFQGADLASFLAAKDELGEKVTNALKKWVSGTLSVSFRSTAPVLNLVDAVFETGPAREGVYQPKVAAVHQVSRTGQAGRVELWPIVEKLQAPALPDWKTPDEYTGEVAAKTKLATQIAQYISSRLRTNEILPSRGRTVIPSDFLILVRKRDALMHAITAACKAESIPIAGVDRLVLTELQAVSDLLALCAALLTPSDDLAFAQYLVSPLGGLSDESLMKLAIGREKTLLDALYKNADAADDWRAAKEFFEALRKQVDYSSPFALLSESLGPLGGRAKLLRRLGPDMAEPIDELLTEALNFAVAEPGSLQMFLHAIRQSGATVKREAEAGGDVVRIMTVHGAKGLQAPIVILPDTMTLPKASGDLYWLTPPQQPQMRVPIYCPRKELSAQATNDAANAEKAAMMQEYNRLLYVALTRAEDELIVCGAQGGKAQADTCWYELVRSGFIRLGIAPDDQGIYRLSAPQKAPPDRPSTQAANSMSLMPVWAGNAPDWRAEAPVAEQTKPERLAPSRSAEDVAKRAVAASPLGSEHRELSASREAAIEKGRLVHALLQHLPEIPATARREAAMMFLAQVPALAGDAEALANSVLAIVEAPALVDLFGQGSRAEVPLAGIIGGVEIGGLVDRLIVTPERVIIADYKTDRVPPETAAGIPPAYLGQLAAYRAILAQIYPGRAIICQLIWTQSARIMPVPLEMLDRHAPA